MIRRAANTLKGSSSWRLSLCATRLANMTLASGAGNVQYAFLEPALLHQTSSTLLLRASFSTSDGNDNNNKPSDLIDKPAFVHPLSQIVLEHLQTSQSEFLTRHGLDKSLTLHKDGTFTLQFADKSGKIWTAYEPEEKKHWLSVQKGELVGRFLLQDNLKPAWHSDKRSVPEKIQDGVDEMIRKLSEV